MPSPNVTPRVSGCGWCNARTARSPGLARYGLGVTDTYRASLPLTRFVLIAGSALTFLAGIQLFVLSDNTAEYFAWTIAAGSTAAVIGAFYWTAALLALLSWRHREWVFARAGVVGVTFFLWATLATFLVHLGNFHLSGSGFGRWSAWIWLSLYICYPVLVSISLVMQVRAPGTDPPRTTPLAPAYRYSLGVVGCAGVALGALMLIVPEAIAGWSATPLTPLTARAIGSWVLAAGVIYLTMMVEDDAARIRPPAIASVFGALLLLVVLARYWPQLTWGGLRWSFLLLVVLPAGLGLAGILAGGHRPPPAGE